MGFPFTKIFKQATELLRTKKFLRIFGLFLVWGNIFQLAAFMFLKPTGKSESTGLPALPSLGYAGWILLAVVCFVAAAILIWYYFYSRAGIALAVNDLMQYKNITFADSFKQGRQYVNGIAKIWLITVLPLLGSFLVALFPILYLHSLGFYYRALFLGLFAAILLVPIIFLAILLNVFAVLFFVLNRLTIIDSFRATFDFVNRNFWNLITVSVAILIVSTVVMFFSLALGLSIGSLVVILGKISYDMGGPNITTAISIIGYSIGFGVFFWLMVLLTTFQHVFWILVFLEIVKAKKAPESQAPEVLPEVIS